MSNANRDAQGRWSSANIARHTPSTVANGGAPNIATAPTATRPGTGGMAPATSIAHNHDRGNAGAQTTKLLNTSGTKKTSGGGRKAGPPAPPRDFTAGFRALGLGKPQWGAAIGKVVDGAVDGAAQGAAIDAETGDYDGGAPKPAGPYDQAYRTAGYGSNEGPGTGRMRMPGGPSYYGSDVPGSGMPTDFGGVPGSGPRDWSPGPRQYWPPSSAGDEPGPAATPPVDLQQGDDGVWSTPDPRELPQASDDFGGAEG